MNQPGLGTANVISWSDLQQGMEVCLPFVIEQKDMEAFAKLSGDRNPLHMDESFARRKGFSGRVVYGALIVSHISRLIGMHLPGQNSIWTKLTIDFRLPLIVGEEAVLKGILHVKSDSVRMLTLRLTLTASDRILADGSAEVMVKE